MEITFHSFGEFHFRFDPVQPEAHTHFDLIKEETVINQTEIHLLEPMTLIVNQTKCTILGGNFRLQIFFNDFSMILTDPSRIRTFINPDDSIFLKQILIKVIQN
jgi:hypothetical protein